MTAWRRGTKPTRWYPRRGEVCLINLDKECPALVISSDSLNAHSLDVCVLPISSAEHKAFSLRPKLKAAEGGLLRDSWVKCDQSATVEKQLVVYPPLGSLASASMQRIETAVKTALDLA
ncbi:MAG: type II toxin-antitoxin system PemK/MazF family toxin [Candidatus Korobacteraceae bacterium]|jgi:mRNA-degrading endonuclease toxin of MazEF toxin-antitoxin module